MKVLHLVTSLKIGGAESFLVYLLEKLKEDKDQHFVVYFYDGPNVGKIKNLDIPVFKISGKFKLYDPWFYFRLKSLIKKIKPDLIHSSLWSANIIGRIIAKKLKIPIVCDLHNDPKFNGKFRNFLEKRTINVPEKFIAVSHFVGESFKDNFLLSSNNYCCSKNKVTVITNGIDFKGLREKAFRSRLKRSEVGFGEDDFVIGAIGRLETIKSFDILINVFAKVVQENIKLCIVGDGLQKNELIRLAKSLKIEHKVFFVGQRSDAYKFYPLFDCFAMSSQTEGMSIALLEALCFGLPIVTMHQDTRHEVVVDGENGFLIPHGDIDLFAERLNQLYLDSDLIGRIRRANIELVQDKFDINKAALKYKNLYKTYGLKYFG